jgi:histidine triad (HIT) family protein
LVIPLKHIPTLNDVSVDDREIIGHLFRVAAKLARDGGHAESGYRTVINVNCDGGQRVFHVHMHLLAGHTLGSPG